MSIDVSVIIPTYNRCDRLKATIESVLAQTHKNFELLICDDGSTDGTKEMVEAIDDERVVWIEGKNSGGPATPRNRGVKNAKADWLAFLDSDDFWLPQKLEEQLSVVDRHKLFAVCTNATLFKNGEHLEELFFKNLEDNRLTFADLLLVNPVICSSMLIDKNMVLKVGGFPEDDQFKAIEDYALWLSSSMLTDIYYINKPLTIYRDEEQDSIRGEVKDNEYLKHNRIIKETIKRTKYLDTPYPYRLKLRFAYVKNLLKFFIKKYS